jgi:hypothetical protein
VRRLEAAPERVSFVARDIGGRPPLLLQLTDLARDRLRVLERIQRFHLGAELFLDRQVRPLLPLIGLAQLVDLWRERLDHRFQARQHVIMVSLVRQRRDR